MTIFRAPLANSKGEVMLSMQATGVVPAQATQFRGLWVTMNGLICATNDTGQARKYVGGFALEDPSGLLLVTEAAPVNVPMDGINANAAGAVVTKEGAASLIHQGVGMTVSEPGGPIVVNKDEPALTFFVGLENQVNSGSIEAIQVRASEATYIGIDGGRKVATENWIRQEFQNGSPLGTLMELPATNQFWNNTAPVTQNITLAIGNHTLSVEGSGSVTSANVGGTATGHGTATEGNPVTLDVTVAGTFSFTVAGSLDYVQVEAGPVPSSFIITGDSSASRAADELSWSRTDAQGRDILNQVEGMCALQFYPGFSGSVLGTGVNLSKKILDFSEVNFEIFRYQKNPDDTEIFGSRLEVAEFASVTMTAPLAKGQVYLLMVRWGSSQLQIGYKNGGTVTWGTAVAFGGFMVPADLRLSTLESSGAYDPMYASHYKNLYLWSQDKGTAWLENFFSGVAN